MVHSIVAEQGQCTLIGLQYLQIGANRAALEDLCKRKDDKYENALVEYNESCVVSRRLIRIYLMLILIFFFNIK